VLSPEDGGVSGLRVNRWTRYGKDRLYVMDGDARLGWYDLVDRVLHIDDERRADELRAAVAVHPSTGEMPLEAAAPPTSPRLAGAVPADPPDQVEEGVTLADDVVEVVPNEQPASAASGADGVELVGDLAANRPGETVRARALVEREALLTSHPIRGRIARLLDANTSERSWRVGADGEESVGRRLHKLVTKGWRVLHSVPVGERGSDIDHVLIGPAGVWTVNTKRHLGARVWLAPNQIRIDGHVQPYLRNSRFEAKRTAELLAGALGWAPPVRPALVLQLGLLADPINVKQEPEDVDVLDARSVPRWFARRGHVLTPDQVDAVFAIARVPATWKGR
jgi:hypothetical protein